MSRFKSLSIGKIVLLGLPLVLILTLSGSVYWLLNTTSGAAWLWSRLEGIAAVDIRSSRVRGDLAAGFIIEDLEYRSENLNLLVHATEIEAGMVWWPLSIRVDRLTLQDVKVITRTAELVAPDPGADTDIRTTLEELKLPVPVQLGDAVLTNIILQQDDKASFKLAESVRFKLALEDQMLVDHLEILATDFETRLQGYLNFEPPFELQLTARGQFEKAMEVGQPAFAVPFSLEASGDLEKVHLNLVSQKFGLNLDGELHDPVISPAWNIKAVLDQFQWPEQPSGQGLTLSGVNLVSQGNINDWSFVLGSGLQAGQLSDAHIDISGSGSATAVEIDDVTLTGPGMDVGLSGTLDWSGKPEAGMKAVIRQLDLSHWTSGWPAGEHLAGELELSWTDNRLFIPASRLTVSDTGLLVSIEADIDPEANDVNARLGWSNLRWPLTDTTTAFSSESGQLSVSGSFDDWMANGQLELQVGDYPKGRFEVRGGGDRTSAHLSIPGGEILGGTLSGEGNADWSNVLNWDAAIETRGIDPEPLLPGWPGQLDMEIDIKAQSEPQQIQIKLAALQGLLREVPVSARGGLQVTDAGVAFESLEFHTDEAVLELNGAVMDPEGAEVKFSGRLPSKLLSGASGSLELESRFSSHAGKQLLELELQALDLAWNGFDIRSLAVRTTGTEMSESLPALQLDAAGIAWEDQFLDELSLTFGPIGDQYELRASLLSEQIVLNSAMNMAPVDRDDPLSGSWQGQLAALELTVGPAYTFELLEPAAFKWSAGSVLIEPACLSENAGGSLCLGLDYQSNGDWSLVADAKSVPFDYLRDLLELDVHFEQLLEGRMEWNQPHDGPPTGGADFRITAGRVLDLLDDDVLTQSNEGRFAFSLRNGNLESGVLDVEFPGTGFIDVDFDVLDIVVDGRREIQGRAIAQLDHLKLLGQLALPGMDAVDGRFESNILLGGSVSDPEFDGAFKLSNGFIHYAPIGFQLEDIEFEGRVTQRDRGSFKGQFRAGEGVASLKGGFLFEDLERVKLEVELAGEQLLLVNTDTLKILTDTDLTLGLSPQRIDISGQVIVPSARLTPENLLLGEVRDSEDLVIETPEGAVEPEATEAPVKTQVYGQLEVAFGDDVLIKVPGIETSISGSTRFNWSGEPVPMADGAYTLQGKVDVYGPRLDINNGSISFPGVPADNPLLNIRAGRDIFGNTQIRRAGVQVIGSLKRPVLEAYTVPVTNEDRAWTLLITGSDFDQGQGVSGFDVGTYIAPRLYVSYGISLFEDENVISARYDLKRGFGVKVTSGQRETGLDVSYTIDK
ncbi:MAG: translocation/assembly module TamB domain-containing protein [Xanthomonadales bacterium]|nr:translocation/assembly module TamB domain-containing protein [Xanthomonadales bacterium]